MVDMQEFYTAISNFGFPVVVAGYLLFRFENKIEKLGNTISELKGSIDELKTEVIINSNRRKK